MSKITDFVDSCGRIVNGSLAANDVTLLREVTETVMPTEYKIPFPEDRSAGFAPEDTDQVRGLYHELAQHLTDLRYLSEAEFIAYRKHHKGILQNPTHLLPIVRGATSFATEEDWGPQELPVPLPSRADDLHWLHQHLPALVERISPYLSWDGSLRFPLRVDLRERGCWHRSLAYRLRTLATPTFPFPRGEAYFTAQFHPQLLRLATNGLGIKPNQRGIYTTKKFWAGLTDIDLLLKLRRKQHKRLDAPLIYQIPDARTKALSPEDFATASLDLPRPNVNYFNQQRAEKLRREAVRWEGQRTDDLSTRLLQIKLWQLHYYVGAIDGDWGKESHKALLSYIGEQSDIYRKNRPLGRFTDRQRRIHTLLLPVNFAAGIYLADFRGLTNSLLRVERLNEEEAREAEGRLFSELGTQLDGRRAQLERKVLNETGVATLYPPWRTNFDRRTAYTRRSFLGRIFAGIGRIVDWVKGKIVKVVKRLGGIIFGFVKLLLHKVRTGVQRFFTGFRYLATFLLGKPLLTAMPANDAGESLVFATKFQLDFDAVNVVPAGFRGKDVVRHSQHIYRMIEGMDYFIQTTIDIIRLLIKLGTPRGWLALGWQIGLAVIRSVFKKPEQAVLA